MAGDQAPVTKAGRIPQVGVLVPADELHQRLDYRRAAGPAVTGGHGQRQMPGGGEFTADPRQLLAAQP